MTNEEALALLSRMDADQRTMDSLMAARKHVREVIERYQAVVSELPTLEAAYEECTKVKGQLQQEAMAVKAALDAEIHAKRTSTDEEVSACSARVHAAREQALVVERELQEKERLAVERITHVESEIQSKVAHLKEVESALQAFKTQHELG